MVVEHIDTKEQDDVDEPSADGHSIRRKEERWALRVELRYVSGNSDKEELDKCQKRPFEYVSMFEIDSDMDIIVPLAGSTLMAGNISYRTGV